MPDDNTPHKTLSRALGWQFALGLLIGAALILAAVRPELFQ